MESLVHYQTMLVRHHNAALGEEERERLRANTFELLQQLETQDPLRKQRYRDIGQCGAHPDSYHRYFEETRFVYLSLVYTGSSLSSNKLC